jgi:hypothetical protein
MDAITSISPITIRRLHNLRRGETMTVYRAVILISISATGGHRNITRYCDRFAKPCTDLSVRAGSRCTPSKKPSKRHPAKSWCLNGISRPELNRPVIGLEEAPPADTNPY